MVIIFQSLRHVERLISSVEASLRGLSYEDEGIDVVYAAEVSYEDEVGMKSFPKTIHLGLTIKEDDQLSRRIIEVDYLALSSLISKLENSSYHLYLCLGKYDILEWVSQESWDLISPQTTHRKNLLITGLYRDFQYLVRGKKHKHKHKYNPIASWFRDIEKYYSLVMSRLNLLSSRMRWLTYEQWILSAPASYVPSANLLSEASIKDFQSNVNQRLSTLLRNKKSFDESLIMIASEIARRSSLYDDFCQSVGKSLRSANVRIPASGIPADALVDLNRIAQEVMHSFMFKVLVKSERRGLMAFIDVDVAFDGLTASIHPSPPILRREPRPWYLLMPNRLIHRIGFLPTMAHFVPHLLFALESLVSRDEGLRTIEQTIQKTKQSDQYFIEEAFCDAIATQLVGPAYLYSMMRFPLDQDNTSGGSPSFTARIILCRDLLTRMGFNIPINFPGQKDEYCKMVLEMLEEIMKRLPIVRYCVEDHKIAIGQVKSLLKEGVVMPEKNPNNDPRLLLNALWDEVVNGDGYVNEMALLFSLCNFKARQEPIGN